MWWVTGDGAGLGRGRLAAAAALHSAQSHHTGRCTHYTVLLTTKRRRVGAALQHCSSSCPESAAERSCPVCSPLQHRTGRRQPDSIAQIAAEPTLPALSVFSEKFLYDRRLAGCTCTSDSSGSTRSPDWDWQKLHSWQAGSAIMIFTEKVYFLRRCICHNPVTLHSSDGDHIESNLLIC